MNKERTNPLFQPLTIGKLELKNRLVVAPMVSVFCDEDGMATERYIAYHEEKAKGGWGTIITEDYVVDPAGRGFYCAGLWKDEQIDSHRELTERVKKYGTKVIAQIYHAGRQANGEVIGQQKVSASPLPCPVMGGIPRELTEEEIKKIVSQFGDTALRAKKAGFDGVEVHGAHGYLIAQFMSSYSNKRTDKYGGSLENRLRFPLEIVAEIRKKCGPDYFVGFRISANEFVPGGRDIEETKAAAVMLEKQGVDAIHVSAGTYQSTETIIQPMHFAKGFIVDDAEEVKKAVNIPVMTVGRINDPKIAESVLQSGKADLVAMGRGSLADPALPKKYAEGRYDDIRLCLGCQQGCVERLFVNTPIRCLINPTLGFEYLNEFKKAENPKKVAVVGAGPAGLEAARTAALAGHDVTVYEETNRLGGLFATATLPPSKGDMGTFVPWLKGQLEKLNVTIKLNTKYTAALCDEENPDVVIVATGSTPYRPSIEGIDGENVVTAEDVLEGRVETKQNVVIAGGGLVGCETSLHLAALGKKVTIVEQLPAVATDEEFTRRVMLMRALKDNEIVIHTDSTVKSIYEDSVQIEKDGTVSELKADTVVLALGYTSHNSLAKELEGKAEVKVIGDALEVRDAVDAVREGFLAATQA